jgi:flagellar basal body-associated protein FliL
MDDMEEEGTQNLKLLKIIVVALGILIVIMLAVIVGTVIYRMSHTADEAAVETPSAVTPDLAVPPGSTLQAMTPTDRELYLHVRDGAGGDHVYALDRKSGALLWHRRLIPGS